jgi:predicted TIM-barrel fold metal-dependent hydrolase
LDNALPMIIDAHTHLLPEEVAAYRASFIKRDTAFRLLFGNVRARLAKVEDLLETMDRNGVNQSVICGFPWEDPTLCREGNDFLWQCGVRYPGRLLPFASLPPRSLRAGERELARCLDQGFIGIGELAFYQGALADRDISRLTRLLKPLSRKGIPVLLHVNEPVGHAYPGKIIGSLQAAYRLLQNLPEVTFIFAHWGGGFFFYELMPEVAEAATRVYYDTAASPFLYRPSIYSLALRIIGPQRILFGSDYPLIPPQRYFREMVAASLPARVQSRIKGLNAHRLFAQKPDSGLVGKDRV